MLNFKSYNMTACMFLDNQYLKLKLFLIGQFYMLLVFKV